MWQPDPLAIEIEHLAKTLFVGSPDFIAAATRILACARVQELEMSAKYRCNYCESGAHARPSGVESGDHWEHQDGRGKWSIWCDSSLEQSRMAELRKVIAGK